MSGNRYDIVDMAEEASKGVIEVGTFVSKVFYHVSNLDALAQAMDSHIANRFKNRIREYLDDYNKLSDKQKKDFYTSLKNNSQNVNYLYEFFERTRTTAYEIHAKLLLRLLVELVENNDLSYFESNLLSNINTLNDRDILKIKDFITEYKNHTNLDKPVVFHITSYDDINTFNKCIQLGIIIIFYSGSKYDDVGQKTALEDKDCNLTIDSHKLLNILDDIIDD